MVTELEMDHAVWLDSFTEDDLERILLQEDIAGNVVSGYLVGQVEGDMQLLKTMLEQVLPIIGEEIMAPLAARLKSLGFDQAILIPDGQLSVLPLHAAQYCSGSSIVTFLDDFNVAYTPSARSLIASYAAAAGIANTRSPSLFAVSDPPRNDVQRLPFASGEVSSIVLLFPPNASHPLYEDEATRQEVLTEIANHSYLHFACHGYFSPLEPLHSALLLQEDDDLTLSDLLNDVGSVNARLVVLSACRTAIPNFMQIPDEVLGLPAGFLQAGVAGVVGSLWPVTDLSTALLMERFYINHLLGDLNEDPVVKSPLPPAEALRRAQIWLRDVTAGKLARRFKIERKKPDAKRMISYEQASDAWQHFAFDFNEDDHPYAHPMYWAAFTFNGV